MGRKGNLSPFTVFKYAESSDIDSDFGPHPGKNRFRANEVRYKEEIPHSEGHGI